MQWTKRLCLMKDFQLMIGSSATKLQPIEKKIEVNNSDQIYRIPYEHTGKQFSFVIAEDEGAKSYLFSALDTAGEQAVLQALGEEGGEQAAEAVDEAHGHKFVKAKLSKPSWCAVCQAFIWGLGKSAYVCQSCQLTTHKRCVHKTRDHCTGQPRDFREVGTADNSFIDSVLHLSGSGSMRGSSSDQLVDEEFLNNNSRLVEISRRPGNNVCADCRAPGPTWASSNLGVFICIHCSGAHRQLGAHLSKVLSVRLDEWTDDQISFMEQHGNAKSPFQSPDPSFKLTEDTPQALRNHFIAAKYDNSVSFDPSSVELDSDTAALTSPMGSSAKKPSSSNLLEAQQSIQQIFAGILSLRLLRGTNLVSRDINGLSDPYVVMQVVNANSDSGGALGSSAKPQKSKVCKRTLNPDWNAAAFNFNVSNAAEQVLKFEVFDKDVVGSDDLMGHGRIQLDRFADQGVQDLEIEIPLAGAKDVTGSIFFRVSYTPLSQ